MILIKDHLPRDTKGVSKIPLQVDRRKLAKLRWRGQAQDGTEFGFDLAHPLSHGLPFHKEGRKLYRIELLPEPVLRIPFRAKKQAALYGWMVGNMHFSAAFEDSAVIAEDDPAVRQMLERNRIRFEEAVLPFQPATVSHGHQHSLSSI